MSLGLNHLGERTESQFLNLNRDSDNNQFDYAEMPEGLVFFSKAINLLVHTLKIKFTYQVIKFTNDSKFRKLGNTDRKALIVTIQNEPQVYLIEVDSSDDKYISTLLMTNLRTKKSATFLSQILIKSGNKNGVWPEDYLLTYCDYVKVKHPKLTKKMKQLPVKEKDEIYIKRLTYKLLRVLT